MITAFDTAGTFVLCGGDVSAEGVENVVKDAGGMTLLLRFVFSRTLQGMMRFLLTNNHLPLVELREATMVTTCTSRMRMTTVRREVSKKK